MAPVHSYASPYIHTPHTFICPWHPHMSPVLPCASVCSRGICMWYGDAVGLQMFGPPRGSGCLPRCLAPPCIVCPPVYLYVLGDLCIYYGGTILLLGVWGTSAYLSGLLVFVSTSIGCPLCFVLYLSCSSLCLRSLLPWLWLLLLQWQWCLQVCQLCH